LRRPRRPFAGSWYPFLALLLIGAPVLVVRLPWPAAVAAGAAVLGALAWLGHQGRKQRSASAPKAPDALELWRAEVPLANAWLYTVVTVASGYERDKLAIPTIDVTLVHAALALAPAETAAR
jgi:hypothetical protein